MGAAEEFAKYLDKYLAEVSDGPEGDLQMRERLPMASIVDTTDENVLRDNLSDEEIDSWTGYMAWNLWELLAKQIGPAVVKPKEPKPEGDGEKKPAEEPKPKK